MRRTTPMASTSLISTLAICPRPTCGSLTLTSTPSSAARGQSLIASHHADRTAGVEQHARHRLADLARALPVQPIAAVRASRGTVRLFLVGAASKSHACYLTERLVSLEHSPWGTEL